MSKNKTESLFDFGKGWFVIIFGLLMFWFYAGMVNDSTNVVAPAVAEKLGIPAGNVISMGTVAGIIAVIFFIIMGQVNNKIGARIISFICLILASIGYTGMGSATSLAMYTIFLCITTIGAMSAGYIAGGALVAQWFPKTKGIVMGYTTMFQTKCIKMNISLAMIGLSIGGSANFTTSLPAAIFGRHDFEKVNSFVFPLQALVTSMSFAINGIILNLTGECLNKSCFCGKTNGMENNFNPLHLKIVYQCAPVLACAKISNLLVLEGYSLNELYDSIRNTGISSFLLYKDKMYTVHLLYRRNIFLNYFINNKVIEFLNRFGYRYNRHNINPEEILALLGLKYSGFYSGKNKFPHEMGIFLGYPIDDVKAFIENRGKNFLLNGYWKVYFEPENAIQIFNEYDNIRKNAIDAIFDGYKIPDIYC